MAKNQELLHALNDPELFKKEGAEAALDALVKAGNDLVRFRAALLAKKEFWIKFVGLEDSDFSKDDSLTADGGGNDDYKLETLFKLVAEKRVILALQSQVSEAILQGFITADTEAAVRTFLATEATANVTGKINGAPGWAVGNEDVLTDDAIDRIQLTAQHVLLAKKINALEVKVENVKKINDLVLANNNDTFRAAVKALGVPDAVAAKMAHDGVGQLVRIDSLRKSFAIQSAAIFAEHYALADADDKLNPYEQLVKNDAGFVGELPVPYNELPEANAPEIKGYLGAQYISARINTMAFADLQTVAKCRTDAALRLALKQDDPDAYLSQAVTPANMKAFRTQAASRALVLKIEQASDLSGLKEISEISSPAPLNGSDSILKKKVSFGFAGDDNQEIRALIDVNGAKAALSAAHVRLHMLTGSADKLQTLIKSENAEIFLTKYEQAFPLPLPKNVYKDYFDKAENRQLIREQALIGFAKSKFADLSKDELQTFLSHGDGNGLQGEVAVLLGNNDADDLILDGINDGINPRLRAYATMAFNLKNDDVQPFDELLATINGLNADLLVKELPLSERMSAQAQLTTLLLPKCPADKMADLLKLIQAADITEFKAALTTLGFTAGNMDWVDVTNMKAVQEAALPRAIEIKIDESSVFGVGVRPELGRFLKNLPAAKQKALLANPQSMVAIVNTTAVAELAKLVKVANADIKLPLVNELNRIKLSGDIFNAKIARILASTPAVTLDVAKINKINELLKDPDRAKFDRADVVTTVRLLSDIINPSVKRQFNEAFGLNADGNNIDHDDIRKSMKAQHKHNVHLLAKAAGSPAETAILNHILTLNKGIPFADAEITPLFRAFSDATSREDLIQRVKGLAIGDDAKRSFEQSVTLQKYNALKRPLAKSKFLEDSGHTAFITANKVVLEEQDARLDKLASVDKDIRKELKRLGSLTAMEWLNPAFQSSAKQNAHAMKPKYEKLAAACDIIVPQLSYQYSVVKEQLDSLPGIEDVKKQTGISKKQRKEIEEYRSLLIEKEKSLNNALGLYTKAQTVLNGDENKHGFAGKGVLKTLDEAMEGRPVKFLGFNSKSKIYKRSEMSAHLGDAYNPADADPVRPTISLNGKKERAYTVDPDSQLPGNDEFLEVTIGSGASKGCYIIERGQDDLEPKFQKGQVDFPASVKITVNKTPAQQDTQQNDYGDDIPGPKSNSAWVTLYMGMASDLVAGLAPKDYPSKNNQILFTCDDPVMAAYIWTALMVIGRDNPKMKFGNESIKVICPSFEPKDQLGYVGRFARNSLYETQFSHHPALKKLSEGIRDLSEDQAKAVKPQKQMDKTVNTVNSSKLFKSGHRDVLESLKQNNEENPHISPAPPVA